MSFQSRPSQWTSSRLDESSVRTDAPLNADSGVAHLPGRQAMAHLFRSLMIIVHLANVSALGVMIAMEGLARALPLALGLLALIADGVFHLALGRRHTGAEINSKAWFRGVPCLPLIAGCLFSSAILLGYPLNGSPLAFGCAVFATFAILAYPAEIDSAWLRAAGTAMAVFAFGQDLFVAMGCLIVVVAIGLVSRQSQRSTARTIETLVAGHAAESRLAALAVTVEQSGTAIFWETDRADALRYLSAHPDLPAVGIEQTMRAPTIGSIFALPEGKQSADLLLATRQPFLNQPVIADYDGAEHWWSLTGTPAFDSLGRFLGFRGHGAALTGSLGEDAAQARKSRYDALTGLAGRGLIHEMLEQAMQGKAGNSAGCALFLLDLDRFKQVNDTLGHPVGDEILKLVSERLRASVGSSGQIGRLGGDEFLVVLPGETGRGSLADLARAVIAVLSKKYLVGESTVSIGASIGIAIAPYDGDNAKALIAHADMALYASKTDGRGVHRFYDPTLTDAETRRRAFRQSLRDAIANDAIDLNFQPFVHAESGRIAGFEALARWHHPSEGVILPPNFLPVVEALEMENQLGRNLLRKACREALNWPSDLRIAVNVSRGMIETGALAELVEEALDESGLQPGRLEIDIADTIFSDCRDQAAREADRIRRMGARVALDDFGAGESSLNNLKCAAIDRIKLDPSFIVGASDVARREAAIFRSIVGLAESLGIETLTEGVESQEDAGLAHLLGSQNLQGYAFGKPMQREEIAAALAINASENGAEREEARKAERTTLFRAAMVYYKDLDYKVILRNISAMGASVECGKIFPANAIVALDLGVGDPIAARVVWSDSTRMGLRFTIPFDTKILRTLPRTESLRDRL